MVNVNPEAQMAARQQLARAMMPPAGGTNLSLTPDLVARAQAEMAARQQPAALPDNGLDQLQGARRMMGIGGQRQ